ncbi:MAG: hypothetical protein J7J02_09590 [Sulfurovum sp.]|nr:hypothetical protein [Sulfurovum sp.]
MYRKLILLLLLSFSVLYAEESTSPSICNDDLNTSLFKNDLNSYIYTWNALGTGGGYRPLISADLNTSAYDWNALTTKWINMRAAAIIALDKSQFYQDDKSLNHVGDMGHYDKVDVRGVRLGAIGTINFDKAWTYAVMLSINSLRRDFDNDLEDKITLYDAVVGIPVWGEYGRMQIGKMKEPISMERIMGLVFEQTMERPMHLDALLPSRNIGIDFSDMIFNQRLTWKIGVFNDWMEDDQLSFSESNQQLVARVTAVAYEDKGKERLLHLGAAYRYEDVREGTVRYEVGSEQWFIDPWLDTGSFSADATNTYNLEMSYLDGPLWIASEYTSTSVDSPQFANPTFSGYHVAANYFLTGEHRGYNKRRGIVRRITPVLDFTKGGWGAVEISARYSSVDLTDKAIEGGNMQITSLGLIWHPRRDIQFHMQWSRAYLDRPDMETGIVPTKSDTDILQFRWVMVID